MKPRWHRGTGEEEDFIPVWGTEAEAQAVMESLKAAGIGERFTLRVVDIRIGVETGGPGTLQPFRGVDGWAVPPVIREAGNHWPPSPPDRW